MLFVNSADLVWGLIASFRAPKDGKLPHGLYSFSENFHGGNGDAARDCDELAMAADAGLRAADDDDHAGRLRGLRHIGVGVVHDTQQRLALARDDDGLLLGRGGGGHA